MNDERKVPYPATAIVDLANNFSPEHFRFAVSQCRAVIAKVIAEDVGSDSDQQIIRLRIFKYLDLQLSRAAGWIDYEVDLIAGVMRSLIELKFWAQFISESPENTAQFLHETSIDGREVFEKLKQLDLPATEKLEILPIPGKRIRVEPSGAEEALIWKICSKLIHPSSVVINNLEGTLHSSFQRRALAIHLVHYAWVIITIFHDINWQE
jgi:hypothetical protein